MIVARTLYVCGRSGDIKIRAYFEIHDVPEASKWPGPRNPISKKGYQERRILHAKGARPGMGALCKAAPALGGGNPDEKVLKRALFPGRARKTRG